MDPKFRQYADMLEPKLQALLAMEPARVENLPGGIPESGIYLFSDGARHLYVGRSNRIRQRLQQHTRQSSRHNAAAFAFQLAREDTGNTDRTYTKPGGRKGLMNDRRFFKAFQDSKARIRRMDLRYVEETDQVRQCLLEIYAAVVLDTPYNSFGTH